MINIVVGSCLGCNPLCIQQQLPYFFYKSPRRPFRFDYLEPGRDLSFLKAHSRPKSLTTFGGTKIGRHPQRTFVGKDCSFCLSLDGKAPLSNLCYTMRYDGETIVCSNEYSKIFELRFDECLLFWRSLGPPDLFIQKHP
jgi:hypothetical protein